MKIRQMILLVGITTFFSCQKQEVQDLSPSIDNTTSINIDVEKTQSINNQLEKMAKKLAIELQNEDVRILLREEISKKFDDDYDVLFSTLNEKGIKSYLTEPGNYSNKQSLSINIEKTEYDKLLKELPTLQISMPVYFEKWETKNQIPKVAFIPYGTDIEKEPFINTYDQNGNVSQISTTTIPSEPIIIIGFCERINEKGELLIKHSSSNKTENTSSTSSAKMLKLKRYRVIDLHESWILGAAEIWVDVKDESNPASPNYGYIFDGIMFSVPRDMENVWSGDQLINMFHWNTDPHGDIVFYFEEQDGNSRFIYCPYGIDLYTFNGIDYAFWGQDIDDELGYFGVKEGDLSSSFSGKTYSNPIIIESNQQDIRISLYEY